MWPPRQLVPATHEWVIAPPQQALALRLLAQWTDSLQASAGLPDAIVGADALAGLGGLVNALQASDGSVYALFSPQTDQPAAIRAPFLSQAAEQELFVRVCQLLAQLSGKALLDELARLGPHLERHAQGLWGRRTAGHPRSVAWGELQRLATAAAELALATPADLSAPWATPQAAIDWYTGGGWRMDRAGAELNRQVTQPRAELMALIAPLRTAFRARWEQTLIAWSALWRAAGLSAAGWVDDSRRMARPAPQQPAVGDRGPGAGRLPL